MKCLGLLFAFAIACSLVTAQTIEPESIVYLSVSGVSRSEKARLEGAYSVDVDGNMRLPYLGRIAAKAFTKDRLAELIQNRYRQSVVYRNITVEVLSGRMGERHIDLITVGGEVSAPGPIKPIQMNLDQVLRQANGGKWISENQIILIRRDGRMFRFDETKQDTKDFPLEVDDTIEVTQRSSPNAVNAPTQFATNEPAQQVIDRDTELRIIIYNIPEAEKQCIDGDYKVDADGMLQLPLLQEKIAAKGLSYKQVADRISKSYRDSRIYQECEIGVVDPRKCGFFSIAVGGLVKSPRYVDFSPGLVLQQVIASVNEDRWIKADQEIFFTRKGKTFRYDKTLPEPQLFQVQQHDIIEVRQRE